MATATFRSTSRRSMAGAILAVVPLLLTLRLAAFVSAPQRASRERAPRQAGVAAQAPSSTERRVEALRHSSLEACLVADVERWETMDRCAELSYQLQEAEMKLLKEMADRGEAPLAAADSDSY